MIDTLMSNPGLIVTMLLSLLGLAIVLLGLIYLNEARDSNSWPSTTGTVLTSDVIKDKSSSTDNGYSITYKPEICYSYTVDNNKYVSNRIRIMFNYSTGTSSRAYRLTTQYPKDTEVRVFYNPIKPKDSVLEPGIKPDLIVLLSIGIVIMTASMIFAINLGLLEFIKK